MADISNKYSPDYAIHPGEYLDEILDSRSIKKREFAQRTGLSVKAVSQIINGKSLYSTDAALMFEKALDVSAEIWTGLAEHYLLFEAKQREQRNLETEQTRAWVRKFPTADLKRLGILPNSRKADLLADRLLRFFNVSSPAVWDEYIEGKAVSYRKSTAFSDGREATAVWLRLSELLADRIETGNFDRSKFKEIFPRLREMTVRPPSEFYPRIVEECRKVGVSVVLVPELKGTHVSGAAYWRSQYKAVIAISLRYKTNDHFWFTLFHEAAHLLYHAKRMIYLDAKDDGASDEEREANDFAGDLLIPRRDYEDFVQDGDFYQQAIRTFSNSIGIHPGIVVGRLQHDHMIRFDWYNDLKERYLILEKA